MDDDNPTNFRNLPIYKKGMEIYELVTKITDLIEEDSGELADIKNNMLTDALLLSSKVANAEGGDIYDIRMENAALVRKAARDLILHCRGLETSGFKESSYLNLIREAIEEYRLLFIDWVATFDKENYIVDDWGLFNPPGVEPGDDEEF